MRRPLALTLQTVVTFAAATAQQKIETPPKPQSRSAHQDPSGLKAKGQGRSWVTVVGQNPKPEDAEFMDHRSNFIHDVIAFGELKEARKLRQAILDNARKEHVTPGVLSKLDLKPEATALDECIKVLHKSSSWISGNQSDGTCSSSLTMTCLL